MTASRCLPFLFHCAIGVASWGQSETEGVERKQEYVHAVTRGGGWMEWQEKGVSEREKTFRAHIESRKDRMRSSAAPVQHPVMLGKTEVDRARDAITRAAWAKKWFDEQKALADDLLAKPEGFIEDMISKQSSTNPYGSTCPNCVGRLSQEGLGYSLFKWSYKNPDALTCSRCNQVYPSEDYPETARMICPRSGEEFTFYLNDAQRANPDDRSGKLAYHWVGRPIHVSFTGSIRAEKKAFMLGALETLGYVYILTGDARYAEFARDIFIRFAECYRNWLYHDYWGGVADCDPMFAAWHDTELNLEWKKHLCESAFIKDTPEKASMMQTYWGAGRFHPSTDLVSRLASVALAYDLVADARDDQGNPVWTAEQKALVERDFLLEWVMGGEPFVGGEGQATASNNKAPRVYHAQAAIAKCLGMADYADVALRGYEAVRDHSFLPDGFSRESPAYTNMYLATLVPIPDVLAGFPWPEGSERAKTSSNLFETDPMLRLMYQSIIDQLRPDGRYLPHSDSNQETRPSEGIVEIGLHRYPDLFEGLFPRISGKIRPSEYALFRIDADALESDSPYSPPELLFPDWMTAIFRHGEGLEGTVLSLVANPPGGHRHNDALSLFYSRGGKDAIGDQGYVGDMPINKWIKSTFSHNLVIVGRKEQRFEGAVPRRTSIRLAATSPVLSVVEAETDVYDDCTVYRRMVVLLKGPEGKSVALDLFRVHGGAEHRYRIFSELASSTSASGELVFEGLAMPAEPPLPEVGASLAEADIFGLRDVRAADNPTLDWKAVWKEDGAAYRLWMKTELDAVEASNGPGQETRTDPGRRVRYVDSIRRGENLISTFIALHEPLISESSPSVISFARLPAAYVAGEDTVALRIETTWGTYTVLNNFESEATTDGVSFEGQLGVLFAEQGGEPDWVFSAGARTLRAEGIGYTGLEPSWSGRIVESASYELTLDSSVPSNWPAFDPEVTPYTLVNSGSGWTAYPVESYANEAIRISRFPLTNPRSVSLPLVRWMERGE